MACGLPLRSMSRKRKLTRAYKFWKRLSARWKQAEKQGGKIGIGVVWEKWGVRGAWEAWDRVRRGAPGSVFRVGEGEWLCEICVCGGGFLRGGSCRKGNLGERHDRRTVSTCQKEKASLRRVRSAHLARTREQKYTPKKKKQVYDVCGAPISPAPENQNTRQKEKASL